LWGIGASKRVAPERGVRHGTVPSSAFLHPHPGKLERHEAGFCFVAARPEGEALGFAIGKPFDRPAALSISATVAGRSWQT
jgi:hypothetical protein